MSGTVLFLDVFVVSLFRVGFVGHQMVMVIYFWECENPEFHDLIRMDKVRWLRCLLWHGWLPRLSQVLPCRFCGALDNDGHLFWECTFPPLVEIREHPEFHDLMRMDKAHWPRCLLLHGWLPMLSGDNGISPWPGNASESANYLVETALGGYSSRLVSDWSPLVGFDRVAVSCLVLGHSNVWTDGSLVLAKVCWHFLLWCWFLC